MKTKILLSSTLLGALLLCLPFRAGVSQGQTPAASGNGPPDSTAYVCVARGPNSKVWQRDILRTNASGIVRTNHQSYTELATGLEVNRGGNWVDASEEIALLPDGSAAATNGQSQAFFPADIYNGMIQAVGSDGLRLRSRPLALSYFDGTNNVFIALLTNSTGVLTGRHTNQIIYTNVFVGSGIQADLRLTYRKSGFEQDVILNTQLPDPQALGFTAEAVPYVQLHLLTEFFDSPDPVVKTNAVPPQAGATLTDSRLDFGATRMAVGRAFMLGTNAPAVRTVKQWVKVDDRRILVEKVMLGALTNQMQSLPKPQASLQWKNNSRSIQMPPRRQAATKTPGKIRRLAQADVVL